MRRMSADPRLDVRSFGLIGGRIRYISPELARRFLARLTDPLCYRFARLLLESLLLDWIDSL